MQRVLLVAILSGLGCGHSAGGSGEGVCSAALCGPAGASGADDASAASGSDDVAAQDAARGSGAATQDAAGGEPPATGRLAQVSALAQLEAALVDARSAQAFASGHIPAALSVDVAQLRATVDGVGGQVPPAAEVAQAFSAAGVTRELPVVVYADASDLSAARLLWTLEYMGHRDVSLLDGGYTAFVDAGMPAEGGESEAVASAYPDDALDHERRVDAAWVLDRLQEPGVTLIDARSAAEYGAGHIPGARNIDWQQNVAGGQLLPRAELLALYADIPRDGIVVAYCQTGSRASMAYFVLRHLGFPDVRLYDGSMADWTSDPARPLE